MRTCSFYQNTFKSPKLLILFIFLFLFITEYNFVEAKLNLGQWQLAHSDRYSQTWKLNNPRLEVEGFK